MTGTSCLSGVHSLKNVYILCDFPRVFHGSLPSCTLWEGSIGRATTAPPWEAREGHTGPTPSGAKSLFLTEKRRVSPPVRACGRRFHPRWGNGPVPARSGAIWAPQGPVWQKGKKPPTTPGLGRIWGCDSQAGERPGVAGASPAGSPRPAEPVVPGFLPGSTTRKIRGRLGGLGVTTGVRNRKFPGGKPFFRVSPPGSTKG